jgi:flavodoxin I
MRVLVTYHSETGNTKKVAEAIWDGIDAAKEIKPLQEVSGLEGYDLAFIGFPIVRFGVSDDVKRFLAEHTPGKKVAVFATHASPEDAPVLQQWMAAATEAVRDAELLGLFHCQGALAAYVKAFMLQAPDPQLRAWAEGDDSQGQPDAERLARARTFAQGVMAGLV